MSTEKQQFTITRIYLKDSSFETPAGLEAFKTEWKPSVNLDINTGHNLVETDIHEVTLKLTVTIKSKDLTCFIAEVVYGGLFNIQNIEGKKLDETLKAYCPSLLYPFARTEILNLSTAGSFPQVAIPPINFDALYKARKEQEAKKSKDESNEKLN